MGKIWQFSFSCCWVPWPHRWLSTEKARSGLIICWSAFEPPYLGIFSHSIFIINRRQKKKKIGRGGGYFFVLRGFFASFNSCQGTHSIHASFGSSRILDANAVPAARSGTEISLCPSSPKKSPILTYTELLRDISFQRLGPLPYNDIQEGVFLPPKDWRNAFYILFFKSDKIGARGCFFVGLISSRSQITVSLLLFE